VTDEEILDAQRTLAATEGVFCEPASAASIAGAMRDIRSGRIPDGSRIVCTLTGHGLKDPDIAIAQAQRPVLDVEPELEAVRRAITDHLPD